MFEFGEDDRQRTRGESIVPMINVVFLLLIFFLMSARLVPPAPFEAEPPRADGAEPAAGEMLHLSAEGDLAFGAARGEAVFAALAARPEAAGPLVIRADAGVEAAALARLAARLTAEGRGPLRLVTVPR
ncbi:biopolymer transporter ExbD [Rhodovulum sulfidophilum]|uniref:ExbD/TolR family protein n=1 Tax=Rhodovulum sulfidophilum TaxID=35806 RepID=UPI00192443E5|nr:biopolymer transporter ExbD [Rhodovulum sulfidophilum]MBL3575388.1 biopolymer transporter ExbD [Rhodovulum sulfidophilum]MCE8433938.1 biopolymer transporter ExbD [Rhodovulum sulfidophilum]MCF4116273.1 biopolymer transporter ExbD [Rhodovulum sulfidophilum]